MLVPVETLVVLAVIVVAVVFVGGVVLAALRGKQILEREDAELRTAAQRNGWTYEVRPPGTDLQFRLSGRSPEGITWKIEDWLPVSNSGVEMTQQSSIWWSTDAVRVPDWTVEVMSRRRYSQFRGSAGRAGLAFANTVVRVVTNSGVPLKNLLDRGHLVAFTNQELQRRFVIVTSDDAAAKRLIAPDVEQALLAWGQDNLAISLGADNLRLQLTFGQLDRDSVEKFVEIGVSAARNYLR